MKTKTLPLRSMLLLLLTFWGLAGQVACSYTIKIKDGRTAYERKRYSDAIPLLQSELNSATTRTEKGTLAYLLGASYRAKGLDEKALSYFKLAYDNNYGPDALKAWARTLKKLEQYAAAKEAFKNLGIEIGSPYEFRKEITACTIAEDWLKQAPENGWTIESAPFNSGQNDFAPVLYSDGRIVFTSDRAIGKEDKNYAWTGNKFMDLLIVGQDEASPQFFDTQLNTTRNEGVACFNRTGTQIFFVRALEAYKGDDAFCKIFTAEKNPDGGWTPPVPLPHQKEKINYLHPALSTDGNTLYFSCNDPEGWGAYDLYTITRNPKAETGWDEPRLLSRNINTPENEVFPSIEQDTLYFASDGLQGMGGLDIFKTFKVDRNAWAPPHNLKAPINSGADDFGFVSIPKNPKDPKNPYKIGDLVQEGFFTSNRPGGKGADDIYRFQQKIPPPKPPKTIDTLKTGPIVHKILLDVYVLEKIFTDPNNPNTKILGRKPLKNAKLVMTAANKKQTFTTPEEGPVQIELAEQTDHAFSANLPNYLVNSAKFSTKGIAKDPANPIQTFELEIVLDKIFKNTEIILENIYYDYDKWDIRPDAEPTLNKLADVLLQNPGIRIQLGSHTDCRGNDGYNQELSQRRAQSAVEYLITKGINEDRLTARGFGEAQPAANCACARCTESEHQTNRRTTFTVLE